MPRCPFNGKDCRKDCVLYRKGWRYFHVPDANGKVRDPQQFEECAINIAVDCLESLVGRSIGQQQAQEQTRNGILNLLGFFEGLSQRKQLEDKQ